MNKKVSLQSLIEGMQSQSDMMDCFLNRKTGEIAMIAEEYLSWAEDEELELDDFQDWEKEVLKEAKAALSSDDYIPLPSKFEIHEWQIMKDFCDEVEDSRASEDLEFAVHGSGAFRNFRRYLERYGLLNDWYAFKDEAYKEIARKWLKKNGIEYEE